MKIERERLFRPTSGRQCLETQLILLQINSERFQRTLDQVIELTDAVLISEMTAVEQDTVFFAISLLLDFHKDQNYSDESPYTEHPLGIALQVFDAMEVKDSKTLITALLHDTPEDQAEKVVAFGQEIILDTEHPQDAAIIVLEKMFGEEVADALHRLTNDDFEAILDSDEEVQSGMVIKWMPPYIEKYNALYRAHVVEIALTSPRSALVKFYDFAANAFRVVSELAQTNPPKALKVGKKYLPLFSDYISLFEDSSNDLNIRTEVREKILEDLVFHQEELEAFLNRS